MYDLGSVKFNYSVIAASALYHMTSQDLALSVSGTVAQLVAVACWIMLLVKRHIYIYIYIYIYGIGRSVNQWYSVPTWCVVGFRSIPIIGGSIIFPNFNPHKAIRFEISLAIL